MTVRKARPMRALTIWVGLTVALVAVVWLGGCVRRGIHASGQLEATYFGRSLTTDLDWRVPVQSVAAASEATLRRRGYVVESAKVTRDTAVVRGESADDRFFERTVIKSKIVAEGTRISIVVEPLGDEPVSRAILDDLLVRLGY